MAMYDDTNTVKTSFDLSYITEDLIKAQIAELYHLKKIIRTLYVQVKRPIRLFDIGIGNARVPEGLFNDAEIASMIEQYDGIDNAQACVELATQKINQLNLSHKIKAQLFDAQQLHLWPTSYDMVICTWFTPGNFYPPDFNFETYPVNNQFLNLYRNPVFENVFKSAYQLINNGGLLLLGATYIDVNSTRLKQEKAYEKMGMQIITSENDSFTATKQGFWSQRFTKEQLTRYLDFAPAEKIVFTSLDEEEFALQVCIHK
jgi:hypothetical protein